MTKTKPAEPAIAPDLPNGSIDFNKLHDNDAKGKTGDAVFEGAVTNVQGEAPAEAAPVEAEVAAKADAAPAPTPAKG